MWVNTDIDLNIMPDRFECIDGDKDWIRYRNIFSDVSVDIEIFRKSDEIFDKMCSLPYAEKEIDDLLAWNPLVSQDSREEMVETIVLLEKDGYKPLKMTEEACMILFTKDEVTLYLICHTDGL